MSLFDPDSLLAELDRFVAGLRDFLRRDPLTANLAPEAEALARQGDTPFTMAIVGQMKAGKSTLVNALLGEQKAVVGVNETTATVNWMRFGDGPQVERFRVVWRGTPETAEELPLGEVDRWIGNSQLAERTRYLEFFSSAPFLRRVQIVDTPGSRSVYAAHENLLQGFLQSGERCESESLHYGGVADCLVYVLPPIARETDRQLLSQFNELTRIPGSSVYNSVAVLHKWEAQLEHPRPWEEACRKATAIRGQLQRQVSDVLPVSGPLHHAAQSLPDAFWNAALQLLADIAPETLPRLLLMESRFTSTPCAWSDDRRRALKQQANLPWPCFKVLLQLAAHFRPAGGQQLREQVGEVAGVEELLKVLERRFFSRARLIRDATYLRRALHVCDRAIHRYRVQLADLGEQLQDGAEGLQELASLAAPAASARSFIAATLGHRQREAAAQEQNLRQLERDCSPIREGFQRYDRDLAAMRLLDEHPSLFDEGATLEILTLLGAYGHTAQQRAAAYAGWQTDARVIEERLWHWLAECERSAGARQAVLAQVVNRLEELLNHAHPEVPWAA